MRNVFCLEFANMDVLEYYFADAEGCHLVLKNGIELLGDLNEEEFNGLYEGMPIAHHQDEKTGDISFWFLEADWQQKINFLYENEEVEWLFHSSIYPDAPGELIYVRAASSEKIKSFEKITEGYAVITESGKRLICPEVEGVELVPGVTEVFFEPNSPDDAECIIEPKEELRSCNIYFGSEQMDLIMQK